MPRGKPSAYSDEEKSSIIAATKKARKISSWKIAFEAAKGAGFKHTLPYLQSMVGPKKKRNASKATAIKISANVGGIGAIEKIVQAEVARRLKMAHASAIKALTAALT